MQQTTLENPQKKVLDNLQKLYGLLQENCIMKVKNFRVIHTQPFFDRNETVDSEREGGDVRNKFIINFNSDIWFESKLFKHLNNNKDKSFKIKCGSKENSFLGLVFEAKVNIKNDRQFNKHIERLINKLENEKKEKSTVYC